MTDAELLARVTRALPTDDLPPSDEDEDARVEEVTRVVLSTLAARLSAAEAEALGAELPETLGEIVADAAAAGAESTREGFLEDLASRLDVDDDAAESVGRAVLGAVREWLDQDAGARAEEVLEQLPSDLARLFRPR